MVYPDVFVVEQEGEFVCDDHRRPAPMLHLNRYYQDLYRQTDDPEVKKAVDDILLDFAGEDNPRRACNYGLTEKGIKAMQDAADPTLPHTYAWFVITDCNTQAEQFHRDLTLPDAIRIYSSSDRPEKRIGVTKDGIATVDLVHAQDGEQRFFEDYQKMNSFQNDPEILEAVDRLRQELQLPNQGMSMGGM